MTCDASGHQSPLACERPVVPLRARSAGDLADERGLVGDIPVIVSGARLACR
jgi:hypothetical protein